MDFKTCFTFQYPHKSFVHRDKSIAKEVSDSCLTSAKAMAPCPPNLEEEMRRATLPEKAPNLQRKYFKVKSEITRCNSACLMLKITSLMPWRSAAG